MKFRISDPLIVKKVEEANYTIKIIDFHPEIDWLEAFKNLSWNFDNIQIEYFGCLEQGEAPELILEQLTAFMETQKKDNHTAIKYWFLGISEKMMDSLVNLVSSPQDQLAYIAPDIKSMLALKLDKDIQKINIGYQSALLDKEQEQYLSGNLGEKVEHYRLGDFLQQPINKIEPFLRMKKTLILDTQVVKKSEFGEKPNLKRINGLSTAQFLQIGAYAGMSLKAKYFIFPHTKSNISEINSLILQFIWYYCHSLTFNIYEDITVADHYVTYNSLSGSDLIEYKKNKITSRWWMVTENGWLPMDNSKDKTL